MKRTSAFARYLFYVSLTANVIMTGVLLWRVFG
jgi:hypothetical protein